MSRFLPETWQEAALRPLAMVSPEAGVYVEFFAPDFRFVFILLLLLVCLLLRRRIPQGLRPALALLLFTALAFGSWMATTGNGRYFVPVLLLAGPLAVGFAHWLPATRSLRVSAVLAMVSWQLFLLLQSSPWDVWTYVKWRSSPAFEVDVPAEWKSQPATYVTLSTLSYAIIAPQFHPASRWINVSEIEGVASTSLASRRAQAFLKEGDPLRVIFPVPYPVPGDAPIDPVLADAINQLLARHNLSLADEASCRLLPSPSLSRVRPAGSKEADQVPGITGFWACGLAREARKPQDRQGEEMAPLFDLVFERVERACPTVFPRGYATLPIPAGALRHYTTTDTKLYVLHDGDVLFKYYRSINPERIGSISDVLRDGFTMDCGQVRRRAVLPWLREP